MRKEELESGLLQQKRTIVLEGRITDEQAQRIFKQMLLLEGDTTIKLLINSNGGDVEAALSIYELIKGKPVDGVVFQQAHSVAALVLQACRYRIAYPSACIIIHDNQVEMKATAKVLRKHFEEKLAAAEKRQREIYELFAKRTGRSVEEIEKQCQKGTPLTAAEALAFGLVDRVRD